MRHFYPGEDRGEGFFAALVRKDGTYAAAAEAVPAGLATLEKGALIKVFPQVFVRDLARLEKSLKVIASGTAVATRKGRDVVPEADFALATPGVRSASLRYVAPVAEKGSLREIPPATLRDLSFETVEVSREDALKFLSRSPLILPDAPRGYLLLTHKGLGLGFVKNLGSRTNSLLPPARRIRMDVRTKE